MVFYRKRYGRSRRFKRQWKGVNRNYGRWVKKGYGGTTIRYARKKLRAIEKKYWEVIASSTSMSNGGVIVPLTLIPQGDEITSREGKHISPISLYGHFHIRGNDSATIAATNRVIIFRDNRQHGVLPVVTDVLQAANPLALMNMTHSDRFKIVKSWYSMSGSVGESDTPNNRVRKFYKKMRGRINFIGTGGAQADQGIGNYYMLFITDAGANTPTISYNIRCRFYG